VDVDVKYANESLNQYYKHFKLSART